MSKTPRHLGPLRLASMLLEIVAMVVEEPPKTPFDPRPARHRKGSFYFGRIELPRLGALTSVSTHPPAQESER